jgi:hypothetical protein
MGTAEEEARARQALDRVETENRIKAMEQARALEEYRKQQEAAKAAEAAAKGQNKMTADAPAAVGWPDNEVQTPPSRLDAVAGALGVGKAGDAAFAKELLDGERRPVGDGSGQQPGSRLDGAKERLGAALNSRGAASAVER